MSEKTGWTVNLSPAINHQAANLLLLRLFGSYLGKVSHYDSDKTYSITLSSDFIDYEEKRSDFESETGWKLLINENNVQGSESVSVKQNKNIDKCEIPTISSMNDISNNLSNKEKEAD